MVVGDVLNLKENCLVVVSADGWCYIYYTPKKREEGNVDVDLPSLSSQTDPSEDETKHLLATDDNGFLRLVHKQRIPANTKVLKILKNMFYF